VPTGLDRLNDFDIPSLGVLAMASQKLDGFSGLVSVTGQLLALLNSAFQGSLEAGLASVVDDVGDAADVTVDVVCVGDRFQHVSSRVGDSCDLVKLFLSGNSIDLQAQAL